MDEVILTLFYGIKQLALCCVCFQELWFLLLFVFLFLKQNDSFHLDVYEDGYPWGLKGRGMAGNNYAFNVLKHRWNFMWRPKQAKNAFQAEGKFWNLRTASLHNLKDPVCVMTLAPTSGYSEIYKEGLWGVAQGLAPLTLSDSKNIPLGLDLGLA